MAVPIALEALFLIATIILFGFLSVLIYRVNQVEPPLVFHQVASMIILFGLVLQLAEIILEMAQVSGVRLVVDLQTQLYVLFICGWNENRSGLLYSVLGTKSTAKRPVAFSVISICGIVVASLIIVPVLFAQLFAPAQERSISAAMLVLDIILLVYMLFMNIFSVYIVSSTYKQLHLVGNRIAAMFRLRRDMYITIGIIFFAFIIIAVDLGLEAPTETSDLGYDTVNTFYNLMLRMGLSVFIYNIWISPNIGRDRRAESEFIADLQKAYGLTGRKYQPFHPVSKGPNLLESIDEKKDHAAEFEPIELKEMKPEANSDEVKEENTSAGDYDPNGEPVYVSPGFATHRGSMALNIDTNGLR